MSLLKLLYLILFLILFGFIMKNSTPSLAKARRWAGVHPPPHPNYVIYVAQIFHSILGIWVITSFQQGYVSQNV